MNNVSDLDLILLEDDQELLEDYFIFLKTKNGPKKVKDIVFNLDNYTNEDCIFLFRFEKEHIKQLKAFMEVPDQVICINGTKSDGIEALCIVLRRLSYPNRLGDLYLTFGRSKCELSYIFNHMIKWMATKFGYLLTSLNKFWLSSHYLRVYANKLTEHGAPLNSCWGFIDGTVRPICRPTYFQRINYNGHKRVHAIKFQSVVTPNGLIAHLFGPIEGSRHDAFLLSESNLLPQLDQMTEEFGELFYLYGDPAYPLRPQLQAPFKGANLTNEMMTFNERMSKLRVCVEWQFGKIIQEFAFLDYKKNQKLFLQPVASYYKVGALLTNCHTCLYGSNTSNFFNLEPPKLENYLKNLEIT